MIGARYICQPPADVLTFLPSISHKHSVGTAAQIASLYPERRALKATSTCVEDLLKPSAETNRNAHGRGIRHAGHH